MTVHDIQKYMMLMEPAHMTLGMARRSHGWAVSCSDCGTKWNVSDDRQILATSAGAIPCGSNGVRA